MTDVKRNLIRRAVGAVLFNARNFPERVQTRLLGQNMGPLNEKITDAVLEALGRTEQGVLLHLTDQTDTLKMLRETLSAVQNGAMGARRGEHSERIGRIIAEIDRQRPLGTNGKHGNLHTSTCGCDNQGMAEIIERSSLGTPDAQALRATVSDEKAHALVAEAHRRSEPHGEPSDAQKASIAADALEQAVTDFEHDMGVREFDEVTSTDGRHWAAIDEAWNHQGPFMDWLRVRAAALRAAGGAA